MVTVHFELERRINETLSSLVQNENNSTCENVCNAFNVYIVEPVWRDFAHVQKQLKLNRLK